MLQFRIWNQLKRKYLRRRRSPLGLACMLLLPAALLLAVPAPAVAGVSEPGEQKENGSFLSMGKTATLVLHKKIYLCGEETSSLGMLDSTSIMRLLKEHPSWTAEPDREGNVLLSERIDDLSEACRQNATFGIGSGGSLTLFEGPPKDEKVMKTFYQLDLEYMESALPEKELQRLYNGIRVQDRDEFHSVMSTYNDFAIDISRGVMKRTY